MSEIIDFSTQKPKHIPMPNGPYELYWQTSSGQHCRVSCYREEKILEQLQSLLDRELLAIVKMNGVQVGAIMKTTHLGSGDYYHGYFKDRHLNQYRIINHGKI